MWVAAHLIPCTYLSSKHGIPMSGECLSQQLVDCIATASIDRARKSMRAAWPANVPVSMHELVHNSCVCRRLITVVEELLGNPEGSL